MEVHKALRLPRNLRMKVHKVLRLPRHLRVKKQGKTLITIRDDSENDPTMTRDRLATVVPRSFPVEVRSSMEVHKVLRLLRTLHMEVHKVLRLPRNLRMEVHKVLRLPRNLRFEVHKVLRLPRHLRVKKQVKTLITIGDDSENDPTMIRP